MESTSPPTASLLALGRALQELVDLPSDWDSYGAQPPTRVVLELGWRLGSALVERGLPTPEVFPTRKGGIQLEWNLEPARLEWEIDPDLSGGVFLFDSHVTGEKIDGEVPNDFDRLAEAIARVRYG